MSCSGRRWTATRRGSGCWWHRMSVSSTCTATGCWAPSTTPRTPPKRPCCAPGDTWTPSRDGDRCAWLYRIATTTGLKQLESRRRRRLAARPEGAEVPWLEPYPDRLLDELPHDGPDPAAV